MNRKTIAIMKSNGYSPSDFHRFYALESHPAERERQVVNLATQLISNPNLNVKELPINDQKCAKAMIEFDVLKNEKPIKIKNRTYRGEKRKNKETIALIKSDGIKKEVINEIVAKTALATNSLIDQFSPSLKKHFGYSAEEKCLKFKNIPSVSEASEALREAIVLMHGSTLAKSETKWITGNVIDEIKATYGNQVKIAQIANAIGIKKNALSICLGVYRAFKETRIHGLSFSHHREVLYCHNISPELKMDILINARKYGMSVGETRKLCAYMRSRLELEMKMPEKVLKKHLEEVLSKNMSDHVTSFVLINTKTDYKRFLRGSLTDDMIANYNFIMQVKPEIEIIKGEIK